MKVKMSSNIAVRTKNSLEAVEFYSEVLGFKPRPENQTHTDLDATPLNLFIIEDTEFSGLVLELFVDNLETAKEQLLAKGCEIIRWEGKGKDCYIRDPFGVTFNLWEI
jgi:catechol 2,3-dioxygenase-like lactoylglutathione lyase family enzyme